MPSESLTIKVLKTLNEYPGASIKDVAQRLGISVGLARAVIYRLKSRGFIEKTGYGYVVTGVGEKILSKHMGSKAREEVVEVKQKQLPIRETRVEQPIVKEERKSSGGVDASAMLEKVRALEKTITSLEETLTSIKRELESVKKVLEESLKREESGRKRKRVLRLPKPVMTIPEAQSVLGEDVRSIIYSGRAVAVGSLIVDIDYYNEFLSRFPISVKDAEKMSDQDRMLLEELKNEGRVYLYGGKEYRLV